MPESKPTQQELAEKALAQKKAREQVNDDPMLDEDAAAMFLNTTTRTLQRWRQEGRGPRYAKLGHAVRYRRSWLDAHIDASARTSTSARQKHAASPSATA